MFKKIVILLIIAGFFMSCNVNKKMEKVNLDTEIERVSYSLGVTAGAYYLKQGFDSIDIDAFTVGFKAAVKEMDLQIPEEECNTVLQEFFNKASEQKAEELQKEGAEFLAENAKREGVITLPSGLQYEVITEGTGPIPSATDKVKTHYHGTLIDGTEFDSSVGGEPVSFPVNGVIAGWTEALQLMKVGSKWRLFVPYDLAYGERGAGQLIGPYTALVFDIELLEIEK
ncbi:MAG: FKBP-type peptidyl-prolyl cis-trans isomerase [Bacteroidales bacterium]|nr:FKBP-type peptidyl-prolyl cis-trans isomerase [Bacteroidales bacterium]